MSEVRRDNNANTFKTTASGAKAGAAIGSAVGPIGTAIGTVVGGIGGLSEVYLVVQKEEEKLLEG